jgi:hypothetical protein
MGIVSETRGGRRPKWRSMGGRRLLTFAGGILAPVVRALHVVESVPIDKGNQAAQGLVGSATASKLNLKHHSTRFHSLGFSSQRTQLLRSSPVNSEPSQFLRHLWCLHCCTNRLYRRVCDAGASLAAQIRLREVVSRLAACVPAAGGSLAGAFVLGVHRLRPARVVLIFGCHLFCLSASYEPWVLIAPYNRQSRPLCDV